MTKLVEVSGLQITRNMSSSLVILTLAVLVVIVEARIQRMSIHGQRYVKYTRQGLYNAVNKICCQQGKREIKAVTGKETASVFLQSRGLNSACCGASCSVDDVMATSLNEDCIIESTGCTNTQIREMC